MARYIMASVIQWVADRLFVDLAAIPSKNTCTTDIASSQGRGKASCWYSAILTLLYQLHTRNIYIEREMLRHVLDAQQYKNNVSPATCKPLPKSLMKILDGAGITKTNETILPRAGLFWNVLNLLSYSLNLHNCRSPPCTDIQNGFIYAETQYSTVHDFKATLTGPNPGPSFARGDPRFKNLTLVGGYVALKWQRDRTVVPALTSRPQTGWKILGPNSKFTKDNGMVVQSGADSTGIKFVLMSNVTAGSDEINRLMNGKWVATDSRETHPVYAKVGGGEPLFLVYHDNPRYDIGQGNWIVVNKDNMDRVKRNERVFIKAASPPTHKYVYHACSFFQCTEKGEQQWMICDSMFEPAVCKPLHTTALPIEEDDQISQDEDRTRAIANIDAATYAMAMYVFIHSHLVDTTPGVKRVVKPPPLPPPKPKRKGPPVAPKPRRPIQRL